MLRLLLFRLRFQHGPILSKQQRSKSWLLMMGTGTTSELVCILLEFTLPYSSRHWILFEKILSSCPGVLLFFSLLLVFSFVNVCFSFFHSWPLFLFMCSSFFLGFSWVFFFFSSFRVFDRIPVCCLMLDIELHQLLTTDEVCYCRWSMPYALLLLKVHEDVYNCCCHSRCPQFCLGVFVFIFSLQWGFFLFHACWLLLGCVRPGISISSCQCHLFNFFQVDWNPKALGKNFSTYEYIILETCPGVGCSVWRISNYVIISVGREVWQNVGMWFCLKHLWHGRSIWGRELEWVLFGRSMVDGRVMVWDHLILQRAVVPLPETVSSS